MPWGAHHSKPQVLMLSTVNSCQLPECFYPLLYLHSFNYKHDELRLNFEPKGLNYKSLAHTFRVKRS